MGRQTKNIVDYFPHYCKGGKTIYILESKFGNNGYAFWFKLLELLGSNDNHFIDYRNESDWEFMLAKMNVSEEDANKILSTLSKLNAIDPELWEHKIIYSENLILNLSKLYERRTNKCMNKSDLCKHLSIKCKHKFSSNGIYVDKKPQSKVKESKVKESIGKEIKDKWNIFAQRKNLSEIKDITNNRSDKLKTRQSEESFNFDLILKTIENSKFLLGDNDRKWKVDFDWIIKNQDNYLKIIEGKYNNQKNESAEIKYLNV